MIEVKTEDLYIDISVDVEKWYDASNYDKDGNRPLPIGMNKKVPGLFKEELGGKIMTEFCAIRAKRYTFVVKMVKNLKKRKKAKGTKKCVIKNDLMLQDHKNSLFNDEEMRKSELRFKSDHHEVYTEKINKIALSSNDDKRIQTFDKITTYPYWTSVFKVCEKEMINVYNAKETLRKINHKSEGELYKTCGIFSNYMKRKCTIEMKRYVKLPKKSCKI